MKYQLVLVCSAALISGAALANDDKASGKAGTFETLDTDSDGKLSQEEVAGNDGVASNFAALDGNSDGFISKREFRRNTMPKREPANARP
jgi:hypothetical protein